MTAKAAPATTEPGKAVDRPACAPRIMTHVTMPNSVKTSSKRQTDERKRRTPSCDPDAAGGASPQSGDAATCVGRVAPSPATRPPVARRHKPIESGRSSANNPACKSPRVAPMTRKASVATQKAARARWVSAEPSSSLKRIPQATITKAAHTRVTPLYASRASGEPTSPTDHRPHAPSTTAAAATAAAKARAKNDRKRESNAAMAT